MNLDAFKTFGPAQRLAVVQMIKFFANFSRAEKIDERYQEMAAYFIKATSKARPANLPRNPRAPEENMPKGDDLEYIHALR